MGREVHESHSLGVRYIGRQNEAIFPSRTIPDSKVGRNSPNFTPSHQILVENQIGVASETLIKLNTNGTFIYNMKEGDRIFNVWLFLNITTILFRHFKKTFPSPAKKFSLLDLFLNKRNRASAYSGSSSSEIRLQII
jgi:hypothetical protein